MKKIIALLSVLIFTAMINAAEHPVVVLETTQGKIELELFPDIAPLAVENFTTHVKNGYYNGVSFHRIIKKFMIQGGDPTGTGRGGKSIWGKPFKDEFKSGVVFNKSGILAMANAGPNTNGSQFFITTAKTPWLNGYHTIFGQVIKGMDTVRRLDHLPTTGREDGHRPLKKQTINKAYLK